MVTRTPRDIPNRFNALAITVLVATSSLACVPQATNNETSDSTDTSASTQPDTPDTFLPLPMNPTGDFSMRQFQWQNRVLLVFAPAADERFGEQRAAIDAAIAELADRDMVVIDVIGNDTGEVRVPESVDAEPRRLVAKDIKQLRRDFDVLLGDFTVLLVGKDGGEKRRETSVTALDDIFEEVDGMPMRRREIREREEAE